MNELSSLSCRPLASLAVQMLVRAFNTCSTTIWSTIYLCSEMHLQHNTKSGIMPSFYKNHARYSNKAVIGLNFMQGSEKFLYTTQVSHNSTYTQQERLQCTTISIFAHKVQVGNCFISQRVCNWKPRPLTSCCASVCG